MAKFAIFSDIHIHNFSQFSKLEDGVNSRLLEICNSLRKILVVAQAENCSAVLFGGDFFHTRRIETEVLDQAGKALSESEIPIIAVSGNHDIADEFGDISSIRSFPKRITILNDMRTVERDGATIAGVSFKRNPADLLKYLGTGRKPDILLIHAGINNTMMGADFVEQDSPIDQELAGKASRRLTISGHYHIKSYFNSKEIITDPTKTKILDKEWNLLIPGAPLQHNFGDEGQTRGMWILDTQIGTLEFIPLHGPTFQTIKTIKSGAGHATYNRVFINEDTTEAELEECKHIGRAFITVYESKKTTKENRIQVAQQDSDIIEKYVSHTVGDSSRRISLSSLGRGYLKKAQQ